MNIVHTTPGRPLPRSGAACPSGRRSAASGCWPWSPGPAAGPACTGSAGGPACPGAPTPQGPGRCRAPGSGSAYSGPGTSGAPGRSWLASAGARPPSHLGGLPPPESWWGSRLCSNTGRSCRERRYRGQPGGGGNRLHVCRRHVCAGCTWKQLPGQAQVRL